VRPATWVQRPMKNLTALLQRHTQAFWYVLTVVLPVILRTGKRPVIFSRFAGMGDIICTIPAALALKKRHPGATFIYNCAASFACLPRMAGVTERVTRLRTIGVVGHWYGWLLGFFYHFSYGDEASHTASTEIVIREYGRAFGVETGDAHPRLTIDAAVITRVKTHLSRIGSGTDNLILIHPGPSWPVRTWPHKQWLELLRHLREQGFTNIVQVGAGIRSYTNVGAEEFPLLPETRSLVDQLSVEETIALISLARLFIGIDSGLLHFAACARTTAVGIFGPTSPHLRFAPAFIKSFVTSHVECQGCHHRIPRLHWEKNCPHDIRCMKEISVEEVQRACLQVLLTPKK